MKDYNLIDIHFHTDLSFDAFENDNGIEFNWIDFLEEEEKTIKMEREQCQDLLEYVSNKIAKALHDNFLNEIIITNKEKVVSTYGKKVKKYLGLNISNVLKEQLDDEHLSLLRTSNLQITDDDVIDSTYYYFAIKDNYYNIGGVFILGNKKNAFSEELLNFINAIISN